MVPNRLPEDTPSLLALSYIKSRLQCTVTALLLGNFNRSELNSAGRRRVVVNFSRMYVHEILLNHLVKLVMKNCDSTQPHFTILIP